MCCFREGPGLPAGSTVCWSCQERCAGLWHAVCCPNRGSCLCQCQGKAGTDSASPQAAVVHTTETIRLRYFMDLLMEKQRPVMLVGNAGTGKSVLMWNKLEALGSDEYLVQSVPLNFYTTSAMLQGKAEPAAGPALGCAAGSCSADPPPTYSSHCSRP